MPTCCSNKLYSATFSMNGSILHQATPLALVFAGSLSEAGSAHTCNHSLSSFESNPTKTIQTWLARLFFTVRTGAIELESTRTRTRTRSLSIPSNGEIIACLCQMRGGADCIHELHVHAGVHASRTTHNNRGGRPWSACG